MKAIVIASLLLFPSVASAHRIAVIGGGIGGSFVTKYLSELDTNCSLASITIFEPFPLDGPISVHVSPKDGEQYSRVQAIRLEDGTTIEIGASIAYKDFHLVIDMMRGDPELKTAGPFSTGSGNEDANSNPAVRHGMGIYNGNGDWKLLLTSGSNLIQKVQMVLRYGWDLYRVAKACSESTAAFAKLPELLVSTQEDTYFDSPDDIWAQMGLRSAIHNSFERLLDAIGVSKELSFFRSYLPYQGDIRRELLDGINLVNYNQDNYEVNGMVGLGSFAASSGGLFSIDGGNSQLIASALRQAQRISETLCESQGVIQQISKRVASVVANLDGFELFSKDESLGTFDIVILAAPLSMAQIDFFTQSHFDPAVLVPMTFAELIDPESPHTPEEGHPLLPKDVPEFVFRPYTQVTTTVISNGTLAGSLFNITNSQMPKSIILTKEGKGSMHNITAITQIKGSTGVYKVFSNEVLEDRILIDLFGPHVNVEYVKLWGGPHGGATPQYRGDGMSLPFLIYDGAVNLPGHTSGGAIYYPSSMEQSSLACMELSAIGARAVAKLVARRLGLGAKDLPAEMRDEL